VIIIAVAHDEYRTGGWELAKSRLPVLHYDGTPITARFIGGRIADELQKLKVVPIESGKTARGQ